MNISSPLLLADIICAIMSQQPEVIMDVGMLSSIKFKDVFVNEAGLPVAPCFPHVNL